MGAVDARPPHGVLFLDIEGGFGGSSRSLFFTVAGLDRREWSPAVVSRIPGPVADRYAKIGVQHHVSGMPAFRPSERNNWVAALRYCKDMAASGGVRRMFADLVRGGGVRLIHANHEALGPFADRLAREFGIPWTCHVRTRMHASPWSRMLYRCIAAGARRVVCITENEEEHFRRVLEAPVEAGRMAVIPNPSGIDPARVEPLESLAGEDSFRIICLSNYSPNRGTDLVPDVAAAVHARGGRPCRFHMFGRPAGKSLLPWKGDAYMDALRAKVAAPGVGGTVSLDGHTASPERALAAGHMLLQVRRRANPWGREIIEAMTLGLPVVAVGTYQGMVSHGETGFLVPEFDPERIAGYITRLRDEDGLAERMGRKAAERAARMFGEGVCSARLASVFKECL